MNVKEIPLDQVPGINIVRATLRSLDHAISLVAAGYDFDTNEYVLKLTLGTRKACVAFPWNLLHDIRRTLGRWDNNTHASSIKKWPSS